MDWMGLLSTIVGAGVTTAKSGYFVKTGEVGAITTFGKVKRSQDGKIILLGEGFKFVIPFAQAIIKIHTQKNTDKFSDLFITLKNGISYKFDAYIVHHIINEPDSVENVLFTFEDYKEFVRITFEKAIQQCLEGLAEINNTELNSILNNSIKPSLFKEGICVDDCGLICFTATEQSQQLLGLKYKIDIARHNILDIGIMSAILGATPTVVTNMVKNTISSQVEED